MSRQCHFGLKMTLCTVEGDILGVCGSQRVVLIGVHVECSVHLFDFASINADNTVVVRVP